MKKKTRRKAGLPRSQWKRFGLMLDALIEQGIAERGNVVQGVLWAMDGLMELGGLCPYRRDMIEGDGVVDFVAENKDGDGIRVRFHGDGSGGKATTWTTLRGGRFVHEWPVTLGRRARS